ncbi:PREDICTED: endonuclease 2-like [Erythranthe guttata]|uniref:endonuclease 2-like n=1 Tax=Erythranthe guttata TaxID=4155 RepID=UPI00064DFB96|nr:PREDICTED: endonuclease 2-like [Erythranthe guttata]|eukprot:XP_012845946.1 PREDICTED: endonuclease 2-like [Erythranthe guttata]
MHINELKLLQPLHVGFTSDKGGNTIRVTWFTRKQVLHHVWDTDLIRTDEGGFNASLLNNFIKKIEQEITEVIIHKMCEFNIRYAAESIKAACDWAYKGVHRGSILKELYFQTRSPVVEMRLAQAGVRLAATLNRIFA